MQQKEEVKYQLNTLTPRTLVLGESQAVKCLNVFCWLLLKVLLNYGNLKSNRNFVSPFVHFRVVCMKALFMLVRGNHSKNITWKHWLTVAFFLLQKYSQGSHFPSIQQIRLTIAGEIDKKDKPFQATFVHKSVDAAVCPCIVMLLVSIVILIITIWKIIKLTVKTKQKQTNTK